MHFPFGREPFESPCSAINWHDQVAMHTSASHACTVPWQAFDTVINSAFAAMLVIYAIVAGLGYYYFGDTASVLITDDLASNSPFTGRSVRIMQLRTPSNA